MPPVDTHAVTNSRGRSLLAEPSESELMDWFRNARYAVVLLLIPFTGLGVATRIGEHSVRYVVTVSLMLAGLFVLTLDIAYAGQPLHDWLS